MHCAQARNLIALLVGDDLADTDRPEVERHLSQCSSCHSYHTDLAGTHSQLQELSSEDSGVTSPSLWPEMEPAVRLANAGRGGRQFNGWVAGLAIAATVMAMFAIAGDFGPVRYQNERSDIAPNMINWRSQAPDEQEPAAVRPTNVEDMRRFSFDKLQ